MTDACFAKQPCLRWRGALLVLVYGLVLCTTGSLCPLAGAEQGDTELPRPASDPAHTADGPAEATDPEADPIETPGPIIGKVTIRIEEVFDLSNPKEDNWLFRLANLLHIQTREGVIRRQLLFKPGHAYSAGELAESERILRQSPYLREAEITAEPVSNGVVDVDVLTRDAWALKAGINFGRSGGENEIKFKLQSENFIGTGKAVHLDHVQTVDRSSFIASYLDPSLFGTRGELSASLASNSDGHFRGIELKRPFYALDARWSGGVRVESELLVESFYSLGQITDQFSHDSSFFEAFGGFSRGLVNGRTQQWTFGFTHDEHRFFQESNPSMLLAPENRTLAYLWAGYVLGEDNFRESRNMNRIGRTEDWYLGNRFDIRLGLAAPELGADKTRLVFNASAGTVWPSSEERSLFFDTFVSGRISSGMTENFWWGGTARYFQRNFERHLFFALLEADVVHNLDPENQLLLGGDSGLRGYPLRYQDGDRRVLLTLEQRFYTEWQPFRLANIGGAVFFDAGRCWFSGFDHPDDRGVLKDVGLGLRVGINRSAFANIMHLDLAFPLDGDGSIKSVQWLVTTKQSF